MILILMRGIKSGELALVELLLLILKSSAFIAALFLLEQFIIRKIMLQVDRFQETIFIIGIAWCLGLAVIASKIGLSFEIGAFFAGVALARHPISLFISEKLKPLRDFFLVIFFFVLGAEINIFQINSVLIPAVILALVFSIVKPIYLFKYLNLAKIESGLSAEVSVRMGQLSEFSLLIAIAAFSLGNISSKTAQFIELVTILTMIISSYRVVLSLPTPIGTEEKLIRD
jgi:Kef-type K+ transport system membrane component KefB